MSQEVEDETTVNESYSVTVPAAVRREAGVEAGDKLRWHVDEDGALSVKLVKQQYGAFSEQSQLISVKQLTPPRTTISSPETIDGCSRG
ncbi:AbrB/MazE/SpoVT family DNA-binding domain-containing protein [Halomicroarcula sp. GCM10025710]